MYTAVFNDDSKSDADVAFETVFPDCPKYGSLLACTYIFTAELSAILLAPRAPYLLQVGTFVLFSVSTGTLSELENNQTSILSSWKYFA